MLRDDLETASTRISHLPLIKFPVGVRTTNSTSNAKRSTFDDIVQRRSSLRTNHGLTFRVHVQF